MDQGPPVEGERRLMVEPQELQVRPVHEFTGAVDVGKPHQHRRAVGQQAKPRLGGEDIHPRLRLGRFGLIQA
jgi:hypothetical protein